MRAHEPVRFIIAIALVVMTVVAAAAQDEVQARMRLWSTALGVRCVHCHVEGSWSNTSGNPIAISNASPEAGPGDHGTSYHVTRSAMVLVSSH